MVAGISFDYQEILKNAKKVDREIHLSSSNSKYLKKLPYTSFKTGGLVAILVWLCSLVGIVFGKFSLFDSFLTSIFIFSLVSLFSLYSLMRKMDILSYKKLKKCQKGAYQIYEYKAKVEGFYESIVSPNTNMDIVKESKAHTFILMVEGQKIYLNQNIYEDIKKDKYVKLYIAKIDKICVLMDYKKI